VSWNHKHDLLAVVRGDGRNVCVNYNEGC
jgi:hypothetical protein